MKMQSLIIHDLCTTGECSYFIRGTKWTCTQPPFTEWEHKLQQHLSQVVVHMVAIRSIKQKQNFQHLLKHKKKTPYCTKSHSHSLQWSEESAAFWTLQPANPSFYCHGLSCHSSRRKSWNVSLWKSQENIRTEKRQNYAGQSKLISTEQLSCSLTEVWGQTTKQLEKQLRFFFYFVCINV